jgi:hypothetical protein
MLKQETLGRIDVVGKVFIGILLVIFGLIILHAPIVVGLETLWPGYGLLIKSWKEILLLIAGLLALYLIFKNKKVATFKDPVILVIFGYAVLHMVLTFYNFQGWDAWGAGLAIDLRYLLFFALVYIALRLYPNCKKSFIKIGIVGAIIALVFVLLQVFLLPKDILKYIGYNLDTITPYLTIDENPDFVRINGTFRGPNPLGAYAGLVLTLALAAFAGKKIKKEKWPILISGILIAGSISALWASYSRSAQIGTLVAIFIVLISNYWRRIPRLAWAAMALTVIVVAGVAFANRNSYFISNVLLHENPNGGSMISSNEGHASSLGDSLGRFARQPLGGGIGSTGSASLLTNRPVIIENQYLLIAHEVGWLGLALFIYTYILVMSRLWRSRSDWLALGVFASGVGLALIGLILPVWVDDTVSIIWWGLAAIAISAKNKDIII